MKNKNAMIRILEAFIAIVLITTVFAVLYSRTISKPGRGEQIYNLQEGILDEIASDDALRENILSENADLGEIKDFVSKKMTPGFNFEVKICDVEIICELDDYKGIEGKEIYSNERLISVTVTQQTDFKPKVVKIFMWEI